MNETLAKLISTMKTEASSRLERIVEVFMKNVWDVEDLALVLKITPSRVRHMTSAQVIPFYKQNGSLYFKREEIEAWQTQNRTASLDEINSQASTYCATRRMK